MQYIVEGESNKEKKYLNILNSILMQYVVMAVQAVILIGGFGY